MSFDDLAKTELEGILSTMGTGEFNKAARERLNAIVSQSEEARQLYFDHCQMYAMLQESTLLAAFDVEQMPNTVITPKGAFHRPATWAGLAAAACAMFFIGAAAVYLLRGEKDVQAAIPKLRIATVADVSGTAWFDGAELVDGAEISIGSIKVDSGSIGIHFDHGTMLLVEAPTELVIESDMQLTLRHGRVAARVSEEAHGFTILGPDSAVVDLGTEFAMSVADGRGWVEVYDGEVDIALLNQDGHAWKSRQLKASGPVRIDSTMGKIVDAQPPNALPRFSELPLQGLNVPEGYVDAVVSSKPLHYWRFDTVSEEFDEDMIGEVAAMFDGGVRRFEGGLHFPPGPLNDGSISIAVPDPSLFTNEFSLELWIKPAFPQKRGLLSIEHRDSAGLYLERLYKLSLLPPEHRTVYPGKTLRFTADLQPFGEKGKVSVYSPAQYTADAWQHIVAVRHRDRFEIYLNGKASQSAPLPAPGLKPQPTTITIGKSAEPPRTGRRSDGPFFKGLLDEVAMYPRALSAEEVAEHHRMMRTQ